MKLLVVEDDEKTVRLLKQGFGEHGFVVDDCRNGIDGLESALSQAYDMIVLDVMLPGKDGWEVLSQLRTADRDTPVVMLSARDSVEHKVKGLTTGADDYVVKPFAFSELIARISTILRRRRQAVPEVIEFEGLVMDPQRFKVERDGRTIELTSKEFLLLELLLRHQGEVLSRSFIAEQVWDMAFDGDSNVVEVNIRRLRVKIDDPFDRKIIHTIRGRGYVIR
jgi:two-component system, OmpR family, copper resistance phosphate regulon response regulator CusR